MKYYCTQVTVVSRLNVLMLIITVIQARYFIPSSYSWRLLVEYFKIMTACNTLLTTGEEKCLKTNNFS